MNRTEEKNPNLISLSDGANKNELDGHNDDQCLQFIATMVHDLQSPLVSMKTLLKLIQSGRFDYQNETHVELLGSSILAIERSESIIHDLIDAARTETIGLNLELVFQPVDEEIKNSIAMSEASAFDYGVTIGQDLKASTKARFDRDIFLRVMDNLIFNAIKHSPRGGELKVGSATAGEYVIITISDKGSGLEGINPDDLFDKYKQLDLRSQGKYKGVGIGLYFCRLAVEAMGGKIWAEKNPDGGAVIGFSLIKDRRGGAVNEIGR